MSELPLFHVLYFGLLSFFFFFPLFQLFFLARRLSHWTQNKLLPKALWNWDVFGHIIIFKLKNSFHPHFPALLFFFSLQSTQFTSLLTLEICFVKHRLCIGLLLLVALLHVPIVNMNMTELPVCTHIIMSCMDHVEVWEIDLFWVQCLVLRKLILKMGRIFGWLLEFLGECLAS